MEEEDDALKLQEDELKLELNELKSQIEENKIIYGIPTRGMRYNLFGS